MEGLEATISSHREALTLSPIGHPNRSHSLYKLANALYTRFEQSGRMEDLEDAITFHNEALTLRPLGHPDRSDSLNNLALGLSTRFNKLGRVEDLEEAIISHRDVLALRSLGHPDRSGSLNNLANALHTRFSQLGRMEDLEDAIISHREALALCPLGHPDRSMSLSNLAAALITRFNQMGRMEDLEDAISSLHEVLTLHPLGHPYRSKSLINLGLALSTRFNQLGSMEDLEDAISSVREALTLFPIGNPNRARALNNLVLALYARFSQLGRTEDLEDMISSLREALTLCPLGHADRSSSLVNLSLALSTCFKQLGRMEDLEDAISSIREALPLLPINHPNRATSLNNLANALITRFNQLGRMEDLEDTISSLQEALTLHPLGHPDRSDSLNNLANALYTRFNQLGRMEDLEDAITSHREALTLCPRGHPDRFMSLNNLATALDARFNQLGRMEDLEDAISSLREALTLYPLGHPYRSMSLNNLGGALSTRFNQLGRMEDLEDVISFHSEALTLRPLGHPNRSSSLINLANALSIRFDQSGRMEDLEDAVTFHREALTLRPPGHPDRSSSLNDLARALSTRFDQSDRMEDQDQSFILYEQAANDLTSSSQLRLFAAIDWASQARRYHHKSIIFAYSTSLRILDRCLISHPSVESQQRFLATAHISRSLASDSASAAIHAGNLEAAVELLEQGRSILWSKMEGYRYPLDQLRQVDEDLADHLQTLSIELDRLSVSPESRLLYSEGHVPQAALDVHMRRHRILSEEWEKVVGRVRAIEGFSNFLQAVPFDTLREATAEGPVILINISNYRCDVIILHINNPPLLVNLPNLQPEDLTHLAERLTLARDTGAGADHSKDIPPILRALWNDIVSPVVDRLAELGVPEKSRVWWCPTSELCALPLHAAGPYRPQQKNLPDTYTSSYTTTLSALIRARSNTYGQSVVPNLLVVGQPSEELQNVQAEIDNVQQLGDFVDVLVGSEANRDKVLHGLQQHSWAHFACHGHLGDNTQPFRASFELHGGSSLTLLDLIQARLPNAELAFLSACHSAEGNLITPDETIHLAAALQFCGFRSVVGTLWAMDDEDGPMISKEFYKHMFRKPGNKADFRDSAKALNLAIREMRKNRVPLERWILFVHIGA
jgi:tetratricopeptide (TPR) repeat protein/CHAT domain-containing protein